jgi:isoaspartyl peptidase/L-asparaginase-like protein (Ntn-hydrolase superfamily)
MKRRKFIAASSAGILSAAFKAEQVAVVRPENLILSTWNFGVPANEAALAALKEGKSVLDAVESGVRVPEADPAVSSVGYGGYPDRDGRVTLDACIMNGDGRCGSVTFLQHIMHPVSVARKVMEETPHVMLSGEGALRFALEQGFEQTNLLTPEAEAAWKKWVQDHNYQPLPPEEIHDTIGMIAMDAGGKLAGACTTSGIAFKMHGRVGDSPIIGAGLFVEDGVGAATATGVGEEVIRIAGSAIVVEQMRHGKSPQAAVEEAIRRIARHVGERGKTMQLGMLALDAKGRYGAFSLSPGFQYALTLNGSTSLIKSKSLYP